MCIDPVTAVAGLATALGTTVGGLGIAATVAGGVVTAYSQVRNAKMQQRAANRTAVAQDEAARDALEQGNQESDRRRAAGAALKGENMAALAANGVDVGSEQAIDLLDDTHDLIEDDAFTIRENSRRQATNFAQGAANSRADAASAKSAAFFAPISTILGTTAKVGNKYASMAGAY